MFKERTCEFLVGFLLMLRLERSLGGVSSTLENMYTQSLAFAKQLNTRQLWMYCGVLD